MRPVLEIRASGKEGEKASKALNDVGRTITYHVLMFCLANGNSIRKIRAIADRRIGSMLSIEVSSTINRCIATAYGVPTNSALDFSQQTALHTTKFKLFSTYLRRRASK
jgi:hypothetical protein